MKVYNRRSVFLELKHYDHLSKPNEFLEITEWHNGEGFDVTIGERHFQFTWGEFEALNVAARYKGDSSL